MKCLLALAVAFFANVSLALPIDMIFDYSQLQESVMDQARVQMIDWKVGDRGNYTIDMGFIKGTMVMHVREYVEEGPWVEQNVDIMGQKQKVEILFDQTDGSIIRLLVNGEKQDVPESNMEVEDMQEANITVPAGTFDCVYVKIRDLDKDETSEAWINPSEIPISGMLQNKAPSQFGTVTLQLTDFLKQ
ncbi:MAG: hypothetical protein HRT45_00425 [Bdellovibrionales bacterium]|nr:hypothetical protein [Bdellovibrionales bacterium]